MTATGADGRRRVAIVTDSSACLPPAEAARLGIVVVPIMLIWHGQQLRDGIDISPTEFWRRLVLDSEVPTTSTVSPGEYAQALTEAGRGADAVVCVCIPQRMSTMFDAATLAQQELKGTLPVDVVESGGAAMASGFAALLGARAAAAGADREEVLRTTRRAAAHSELMGVLGSLEYVARSGRIPGVVARLADAVPSSYVLRFRNSRVTARAKFGSRARAVRGLRKHLRSAAEDAAYLGVSVHHAASEAEATDLAEDVRRELAPDDLYVTSFTAAMGAHVGPGLVGISYCALPS